MCSQPWSWPSELPRPTGCKHEHRQPYSTISCCIRFNDDLWGCKAQNMQSFMHRAVRWTSAVEEGTPSPLKKSELEHSTFFPWGHFFCSEDGNVISVLPPLDCFVLFYEMGSQVWPWVSGKNQMRYGLEGPWGPRCMRRAAQTTWRGQEGAGGGRREQRGQGQVTASFCLGMRGKGQMAL